MAKTNLDTGNFMDLISGVTTGDVEYGVELRIDEIYPDPSQPRKEGLDDEGVMGIVNTFALTGGILKSILVEEDDQGMYMIIDGERRWRASKLANKDTIRADIQRKKLDKKHAIQVIANQTGEELSPKDLAEAYLVLKASGMTQREIAACDPKKTVSDISEIMSLNQLGVDRNLDFINDLYKSNKCRDYSTLAALIRLAKKDAVKTKVLVNWAIDNDSLNRRWAKSLSVKDLDVPSEQKITDLEERVAAEQRKPTKTQPLPGMTGSGSGAEKDEEDFALEQEQDGSDDKSGGAKEPADKAPPAANKDKGSSDDKKSVLSDSESDGTTLVKKRVTSINVTHDGRVAKLLLDGCDKEEGFAWIQYEHDGDTAPVRVDVTELSLIFVG